MAGDWIEVEHATPDKPEVIQIADILGLDQDAVFGKLMRLWIWADMQSRDGNVRSVTKNFIDRHTRVTGFADAMKESGWLEENGHGLTFPNFDRHNGETAKKRALSRKRVAKFRAQNSNADVTQQALHKRNHRTEQNNINTPIVPKGTEEVETRTNQIRAVIEYFRLKHPRMAVPGPGSKEWKLINDRLKEGSSADDLVDAIEGMHRTPHNLGENDRKQTYLSLTIAMKDAGQVQRFIENAKREREPEAPEPKKITYV